MPFRDIVGHRRLVALLSRAIARGALPPSLIFAGPSGIGKKRLALATAQALNCLRPITVEPGLSGPAGAAVEPALSGVEPALSGPVAGVEPGLSGPAAVDACGTCASCARIARGIHPDVTLIEPGDTGNIKIEQVREIIDRAAYRPFEGKRRVVIIDEADALLTEAQNALLKTLEEPPPSSVFVLVTARPDMLLPTVQSRCPRLRFRPLAPQEIAEALVRLGRSESDARAVSPIAEGSVAEALASSAGDLAEARETAGRVLARLAAGGDASRRIEAANDLLPKTRGGGAPERDHVAVQLRAMSSLLRDLELLAAGADADALANADLRPQLDRLAPAYSGERGIRAFGTVDRALVALDRNANAKIVADWVVVNL